MQTGVSSTAGAFGGFFFVRQNGVQGNVVYIEHFVIFFFKYMT